MKKIIVVSILMLIIAGCLDETGPGAGFKAAGNRDKLNNLEVGMTKAQLTAIMGKPHQREAMGECEWWLYLTESKMAGWVAYGREYMPVGLVNGKVIGWGRNFYEERAQNYNINLNVTNK